MVSAEVYDNMESFQEPEVSKSCWQIRKERQNEASKTRQNAHKNTEVHPSSLSVAGHEEGAEAVADAVRHAPDADARRPVPDLDRLVAAAQHRRVVRAEAHGPHVRPVGILQVARDLCK